VILLSVRLLAVMLLFGCDAGCDATTVAARLRGLAVSGLAERLLVGNLKYMKSGKIAKLPGKIALALH
jgi:hypothetical protein